MKYSCKKCKSGKLKVDETYPYHDIFECLECGHNSYTKIDDCCRKPYLVVAYNHDLNAIHYQCITCGGANKTKPLKRETFQEQIRVAFNEESFRIWKSDRKDESDMIYQALKQENYRNTPYYKYQSYLSSNEWAIKRKKVLHRDGHLCQICGVNPALDVHHLTYEHLYDEPLEDLQSLCRNCHSTLHKKEPIS